MKRKVFSIFFLASLMLIGSWGIIPFDNVNVKALAAEARNSDGRNISHEVVPGDDGSPVHVYICAGEGSCGH